MKRLKKLFKLLGPGFITGASDDDPSGIATYAQTGVLFGFSQLWTALFTFPFMTTIQEMCGRIGMVTGQGLAAVIKSHYSKSVLYISVALLFLANTINVGANLGAMASSGQLVFGVPFGYWLIFIAVVTITLEVFVPYPAYARLLKYLTISLFAYVAVAFIVKQPWGEIAFHTFVPAFSFSREYLTNIVAILGTTISPYLFFWQSDQESEEDLERHRFMGKGLPKVTKRDLREMRADTVIGMLFSNLVMYFIIVTSASTLGVAGVASIETVDQAAQALRPLAGDLAYLLFAVGIIGTGMLAVPVLAGSAAYAISETFGWKAGLHYKFRQAHAFYGVIVIATVFGLLINLSGMPPFKMLYYTAVLNGIIAPPIMYIIMKIANNREILGNNTNSQTRNVLGWAITAIMGIAALLLIGDLIFRP